MNIVTGGQSVKARLLRAAGRLSLCVQSDSMPYRYVSVEGPITATDDTVSPDERRALAHRYLGAEGGDLYVASTADQAAGSVALRMSPERWRTTDYGKLGEATTHTAEARTAKAPRRCAAVVQVHPNGPTGLAHRATTIGARAGWPRLSGGHPAPKCCTPQMWGAPTALCSATPPSLGRDSTGRRFLSIHSRPLPRRRCLFVGSTGPARPEGGQPRQR